MIKTHLNAYLYWYRLYEDASTEYVYVIATSHEEAFNIFASNGYTLMYDYARQAVDVIYEDQFFKAHNIGDILGENAII